MPQAELRARWMNLAEIKMEMLMLSKRRCKDLHTAMMVLHKQKLQVEKMALTETGGLKYNESTNHKMSLAQGSVPQLRGQNRRPSLGTMQNGLNVEGSNFGNEMASEEFGIDDGKLDELARAPSSTPPEVTSPTAEGQHSAAVTYLNDLVFTSHHPVPPMASIVEGHKVAQSDGRLRSSESQGKQRVSDDMRQALVRARQEIQSWSSLTSPEAVSQSRAAHEPSSHHWSGLHARERAFGARDDTAGEINGHQPAPIPRVLAHVAKERAVNGRPEAIAQDDEPHARSERKILVAPPSSEPEIQKGEMGARAKQHRDLAGDADQDVRDMLQQVFVRVCSAA